MRLLSRSMPCTAFAKHCSAAQRARRKLRNILCPSTSTNVTAAIAKRTHYQVLGVHPTASSNDIRKAFRRLAKSLHPDHNKLPSAREKFQEVKQAYDVLVDVANRADYDRELKIQAAAAVAAQAAAGGRRASTFVVRRNRGTGSVKSQADAGGASGDDFDVFTSAHSSLCGPCSGGGSDDNIIFSGTPRASSRSRSARVGADSSILDGSSRATPAAPPSRAASAAAPTPTAAAPAKATGTETRRPSNFAGAAAAVSRFDGSSTSGSSNPCIFNGSSISPNLGVRKQMASLTAVPTAAAPSLQQRQQAGSPPPSSAASVRPLTTSSAAAAAGPTSSAAATTNISSSNNPGYVSSGGNSGNSFSSNGANGAAGAGAPCSAFSSPPAAAAVAPAAGTPTAPGVAGSGSIGGGVPADRRSSSSGHKQGASSSQMYTSALVPGVSNLLRYPHGTAVVTPPTPLYGGCGINGDYPAASGSSRSSDVLAAATSSASVGDIASRLMIITAAAAASRNGGTSGGFDSLATHLAVAVASAATGGRSASPGSSSGGSSGPVEVIRGNAFQVNVTPKVAVDITTVRPTVDSPPPLQPPPPQQQPEQHHHQEHQQQWAMPATPGSTTENLLRQELAQTGPSSSVTAMSEAVASSATAARVAAAMAAAAEAKAAAVAAEAKAAEAAAAAARAKAAALAVEARLSAVVEATGTALPTSLPDGHDADVRKLQSPYDDPRGAVDVEGVPRWMTRSSMVG